MKKKTFLKSCYLIFYPVVLICPFIFVNISYGDVYESKIQTKKLLITGCARSGTTFISEYLQLCEVDVKHEKWGKDGIVSWMMAVDTSKAPLGPSNQSVCFESVFHQVRHPLLVISSVSKNECRATWNFIMKQIPEISKSDSLIAKSAKYWYYWNLEAEKKADWRYRIEDLAEVLEEMGLRLGVSLDKESLKRIPSDCHHVRSYNCLSWSGLGDEVSLELFQRIQGMALRYGYSLED